VWPTMVTEVMWVGFPHSGGGGHFFVIYFIRCNNSVSVIFCKKSKVCRVFGFGLWFNM